MAITTINDKLAIMELEDVWEPGLPISPGSLGQDDKQQLLWGYPGVLWASGAPAVVTFFSAVLPEPFDFTPVTHPIDVQAEFHVPNLRDFRVYEEYSRGIYTGKRGLYHTEELTSASEPYFEATTSGGQSVNDNTWTVADFAQAFPHTGSYGADPWSLIDIVGNRVVIKHGGWYLIGAATDWNLDSTGSRALRVGLYTQTGILQSYVMQHSHAAVTVADTWQAVANFPVPMERGWWFTMEVIQNTGGPITMGSAQLWGFRIARLVPKLPI